MHHGKNRHCPVYKGQLAVFQLSASTIFERNIIYIPAHLGYDIRDFNRDFPDFTKNFRDFTKDFRISTEISGFRERFQISREISGKVFYSNTVQVNT